jgi:hypothetical protein
MMSKKQTHVIVSYNPLLWGDPGKMYDSDKGQQTEDGVKYVSDLLSKSEKISSNAEACLWAQYPANCCAPIFVIERAKEIAQHLMQWTEGLPTEWFDLGIFERSGRYFVMLHPRIERSVERYKDNWFQMHNELLIDANVDYRIIYRPILFESQELGNFVKAKELIGSAEELYVGFLDVQDLDPAKPLETKNQPMMIGQIRLCWKHEIMEEHIDSVLKDRRESCDE